MLHTHFHQREEQILKIAEQLLLEFGENEFTLDMVAQEIGIAKGTLYKHFKSKNELYIQLLIQNQKQFFNMLVQRKNENFSEYLQYFVRYHLDHPKRTILFHDLEEKLSNSQGVQAHFSQLYQIKRACLKVMIPKAELYLLTTKSEINLRDYLATLWALTYGAAILLNSSFYQRYLGSRETLKQFYIQQALQISQKHTLPL